MTGKDIKKIRKKLKLTQEEFAHKVGVSMTTISRVERGVHKPSRLLRRVIENLLRENN